jgi:hypothetical protein
MAELQQWKLEFYQQTNAAIWFRGPTANQPNAESESGFSESAKRRSADSELSELPAFWWSGA